MSTPSASGLNIVIVISEFNPVITESLLNGAIDAYITGGGKEEDVKKAIHSLDMILERDYE